MAQQMLAPLEFLGADLTDVLFRTLQCSSRDSSRHAWLCRLMHEGERRCERRHHPGSTPSGGQRPTIVQSPEYDAGSDKRGSVDGFTISTSLACSTFAQTYGQRMSRCIQMTGHEEKSGGQGAGKRRRVLTPRDCRGEELANEAGTVQLALPPSLYTAVRGSASIPGSHPSHTTPWKARGTSTTGSRRTAKVQYRPQVSVVPEAEGPQAFGRLAYLQSLSLNIQTDHSVPCLQYIGFLERDLRHIGLSWARSCVTLAWEGSAFGPRRHGRSIASPSTKAERTPSPAQSRLFHARQQTKIDHSSLGELLAINSLVQHQSVRWRVIRPKRQETRPSA
jgi:hypothetical protein